VGKSIADQRLVVDTIFASPLKRAYETAAIIAKEIGYPVERIAVSDLLLERDFGDLEGKPTVDEAASRAFRENLAVGVESEAAITKRVDDAVVFIDQVSSGTALIVSHNGVGKRMVAKITNRPLGEIPRLPNAELIKLEAETGE
jgi:broad specificity phosphatase PhoE